MNTFKNLTSTQKAFAQTQGYAGIVHTPESDEALHKIVKQFASTLSNAEQSHFWIMMQQVQNFHSVQYAQTQK